MVVVVGIVIALIVIAIFANPATRQCRWREYPGDEESLWRCAACGAKTTGMRDKKPKVCLRNTS